MERIILAALCAGFLRLAFSESCADFLDQSIAGSMALSKTLKQTDSRMEWIAKQKPSLAPFGETGVAFGVSEADGYYATPYLRTSGVRLDSRIVLSLTSLLKLPAERVRQYELTAVLREYSEVERSFIKEIVFRLLRRAKIMAAKEQCYRGISEYTDARIAKLISMPERARPPASFSMMLEQASIENKVKMGENRRRQLDLASEFSRLSGKWPRPECFTGTDSMSSFAGLIEKAAADLDSAASRIIDAERRLAGENLLPGLDIYGRGTVSTAPKNSFSDVAVGIGLKYALRNFLDGRKDLLRADLDHGQIRFSRMRRSALRAIFDTLAAETGLEKAAILRENDSLEAAKGGIEARLAVLRDKRAATMEEENLLYFEARRMELAVLNNREAYLDAEDRLLDVLLEAYREEFKELER